MTILVGGVVIDKSDQLDVGTVSEDDELVFSFIVAVTATGGDCE